jgi:hypothetical protein
VFLLHTSAATSESLASSVMESSRTWHSRLTPSNGRCLPIAELIFRDDIFLILLPCNGCGRHQSQICRTAMHCALTVSCLQTMTASLESKYTRFAAILQPFCSHFGCLLSVANVISQNAVPIGYSAAAAAQPLNHTQSRNASVTSFHCHQVGAESLECMHLQCVQRVVPCAQGLHSYP